jgi:large subunit ribosomal protein L1
MAKLGKLGKILGPRNLMPNPKSGTVSLEIGKVVREVKAGKIDFKVDKEGAIHTSIGKASFAPEKLYDNAVELIQSIVKLKPSSAKGTYLKGISISSTMSPGIKIDTKTVPGI